MAANPPFPPTGLAPSLDDIAALGEAALERLRPAFGQFIGNVPIRVQDFADDETLQVMEIENPFELMGLYHGRTLADEVAGHGGLPAMIFLYRRPILDYWCETLEPLDRVVRHVLIHEIGHHFGLSDDDMERIEAATD